MSRVDLDHLRRWIGTTRVDEDVIAARHARLMAATVDHRAGTRMADGEPLPALWHWIYFLDAAPSHDLGRDGHPARGGFLPPVPLANRMWAGGRVAFLAPVTVGATVRRRSTVARIEHKHGRSGDLVFVTVLHELESREGETLIREEHDIVYKDPSPAHPDAAAGSAGAGPGAVAKPVVGEPPPPAPTVTRTVIPTSTLLFRYSALTFNGHRIHYDADYCRDAEGYPNLVVHGPLIATLLANLAEETVGGRLAGFSYRALAPAFLDHVITLRSEARGGRVDLRATLDDGRACMQAEARAA